MAKSDKELAPKAEQLVRDGVVIKLTTLPNGKVLAFPDIEEEDALLGFQRKTRHMTPEQANDELTWLLIEAYLTPEEIAVWDSLSMKEVKEWQAVNKDAEKK